MNRTIATNPGNLESRHTIGHRGRRERRELAPGTATWDATRNSLPRLIAFLVRSCSVGSYRRPAARREYQRVRRPASVSDGVATLKQARVSADEWSTPCDSKHAVLCDLAAGPHTFVVSVAGGGAGASASVLWTLQIVGPTAPSRLHARRTKHGVVLTWKPPEGVVTYRLSVTIAKRTHTYTLSGAGDRSLSSSSLLSTLPYGSGHWGPIELAAALLG